MKRSKRLLCQSLLLWGLMMGTLLSALGQQKATVNGTITDKDGVTIPGVTVAAHDAQGKMVANAATDQNGHFRLEGFDIGKSYQFKFNSVGYEAYEETKSIQKANEELNITLNESLSALEEVVVVGYGTQKKANLTGAVDQIGSEVFEGRMAANATQMLQGAVPNLNLSISDGKPTRSAAYNIRGNTSIGQGGSALVLIDGVEGDPKTLNPNDIETVSVLKDAASSAIYGSRGTFGVVLITTKKAKAGRTTVNYSSSYASQSPTTLPDFVTDGYEYAAHFYEAYNAWNNYSSTPSKINKTQAFSTDWLEEFKRRKDAGITENTTVDENGKYVYFGNEDYYDVLLKDNTFAQDQSIAISGSSEKVDYYVSGRYYDYNGLYAYNTDKYTSLNLRAKGGVQVTDWLRVYNNLDFSNMDYFNPLTVGEGGNIWRNIADEGHPSSPIFNPDGSLSFSAAYSVGDFIYGKNGIGSDENNLRNTTGFETNFFDNKFRIKGDFTFRNRDFLSTRKRVPLPYSVDEGKILELSTQYNDLYETNQRDRYLFSNLYGEYENTFNDKHYFKGLLGYNYEQKTYESIYVSKNGLLTPDIDNINLALGESVTATGGYEKYRIAGVFYRFNYAYMDRYLLEVNGRYDGSSKFPTNEQWAFFPSASAGWRVSQEPFWQISPQIISDLKIRGSYGSLGNGNIDSYAFLQNYSLSTSGRIINGLRNRYTSSPAVLPDNLTWETATTANIGADITFLNGNLSLTGDYYVRKTTDMYTVGMTLPDIFGASSPKGNYADMTTKGFELSLAYNNKFELSGKPFHYNVKATLADYHSVIDRYNNTTGSLDDYYVGQRIGEIWGYKTYGLFQSQEEIDGAPSQTLIKSSSSGKIYPGDIRFVDVDGNNVIDYGSNTVSDHGDKVIIGNQDPRYIYSLNLSGDWSNFFVTAFIQGVGKQDWYPSEEGVFWGQYNRPYNNLPSWHLGNYWTEDNPDAYLPRYAGYNTSLKGTVQSRYLQNAAYVRLRNIQVGYSLPNSFVNRLGLQNIRASLSAENLFTWSPLYKHTKDLDVGNIGGSDLDVGSEKGDGFNYPVMKSVSLGISVTF